METKTINKNLIIDLLSDLNYYAMEFDHKEFGLPLYRVETSNDMINIVLKHLEKIEV